MSPELLKAVKERIERSYSDDKIREELQQVGYQLDVIEEVLQSAHGCLGPITSIPVPTTKQVVFSGARNLIKNSLISTYQRLDLVAALSIPLVLFTFLELIFSKEPEATQIFETPTTIIISGVVAAALLFVYILILTAVLHIVVSSSDRKVSLKDGINWARKHMWNLVWIQILVGLIVMGGFMLLIIPGIILSLYTYFAQYVYASEDLKGMQAILRSRDLVKGNSWPLLVVLSKIGIIFFVLFLLSVTTVEMLPVDILENSIATMIANILMQIFSAFLTLIGLYIGIDLYRTLSKDKIFAQKQNTVGYIMLAIIGVVFPVLIVVAVVASEPYLKEEMTKIQSEEISDKAAKQRALELRNQE